MSIQFQSSYQTFNSNNDGNPFQYFALHPGFFAESCVQLVPLHLLDSLLSSPSPDSCSGFSIFLPWINAHPENFILKDSSPPFLFFPNLLHLFFLDLLPHSPFFLLPWMNAHPANFIYKILLLLFSSFQTFSASCF